MTPLLPCFQLSDITARNAVIIGDQPMDAAISDDFNNLAVRKLCATMPITARRRAPHRGSVNIRCDVPPSLKHIGDILRARTPAEMGRVNTGRVIARVQRKPLRRARISSDSQRNMGCKNRSGFSVRPISKPPVTSGVFRANPVPAIIVGGHSDLRPESGFQSIIDRGHRAVSHIAVLSRCGQGRALLAQRFRPAFPSRLTVFSQHGRPA